MNESQEKAYREELIERALNALSCAWTLARQQGERQPRPTSDDAKRLIVKLAQQGKLIDLYPEMHHLEPEQRGNQN